MKKIMLIFVCLLTISKLFGQYGNDTLSFESNLIKFNFFYDYRQLNFYEVKKIVKSDELALKEFRKGRTNYFFCNTFSSISGGIIGYELADILYNQDINACALAAGGGFFLISLPFYFNAVEHFKNSVEIYNQGIKRKYYDPY